MLIDTHAHLDYPDFQADLPKVVARAEAAGVTEMIAMATRVETSAGAIRVAETYPKIWAAVGIHPLEVGDAPPDAISRLRELAKNPRVVVVGEIGLDYHALDPKSDADTATKKKQAELFQQQLELAVELKTNVVLHVREVSQPDLWEDALRILAPFTGKLRAVFHCFKGTPAQVKEIAALGHLVSFTGFSLYPQMTQISATAKEIDISTFMLETDCPFQCPPPDTDGRCEPAVVRQVAEHIARLRGITVEELAAATTATAHEFFRIG
jgi:TatD DNase family protein